MFKFAIIFLVFGHVTAKEIIVPNYTSTDNTGMGKQERLNSIERQLMTITTAVKDNQNFLSQELPSAEEFKEFLADHKTMKEEVSSLKKEISSLKQENTELQEKLRGVESDQLAQAMVFLRPLMRGDYQSMEQEVESLKLDIRSMQAVIDSLKESP